MNFNVWNIKEMLSIPPGPGTNKPSSWNNNNDYSSLTDSQFLFGSQFCPENSQSLTASLDFNTHLRHAKTSQQNSEDSEPSFFTKYQAKPQLFGGDSKGGNLLLPHLPIGKSKGILEQFEENKKRAQDKQDRYANAPKDSETLSSLIFYVRESMHMLQTSVQKLEEDFNARSQSILDSLEAAAKTLQENAQAHCDLLLDALRDRSRVEQRILEMEKQLETREAAFLDMKSSLKHLEVLAAEHSKQHQRLCDQLDQLSFPKLLAEMHSLGSEAQLPLHVNDGSSQTLPALLQASSLISEGKSISESPDTEETIMLLPHLNPLTSSYQYEKYSIEKQEAEGETHRHKRNAATFWLDRRTWSVKDEAVQTDLEPQAPAKRLCENCDSSSKIYRDHYKRDLMVQETSQFSSMTVKDLVTKARPTCILQEYQPAALFDSNTYDQNKGLEQKGKSIDIRKRAKRKKPRKVHRGTFIRRKSSGLSRNTSNFSSRVGSSQSAASGQQDVFLDHVEDPRQPLPLLCHYKTLQPIVKGRGRTEKTERAASPSKEATNFFLCDCSSPFPDSTEGDKQMRWFSDINSDNLSSPNAVEAEESTLYAVAFDSSDEDGD
ncbi:interactor of HORMAD1 protein 1 [Trichosurus vulpecula]|uniref:interactor of HORMAD1 protein 1 n=1 Tax=Trichosurus vulpecula TaxID=9337 RepID=UPI00186B0590|nr:interactor of HORMAD1 protein 1 [Trichosurus vulpecula]